MDHSDSVYTPANIFSSLLMRKRNRERRDQNTPIPLSACTKILNSRPTSLGRWSPALILLLS